MKNSSRFFENRECEYFPCHEGLDEFNCLFCYCPMYRLEHCPGSPRFVESKKPTATGEKRIVKDCSGCTFPHRPENYEKIMNVLKRTAQTENVMKGTDRPEK